MARVGRFFQEPRSSYFLFGPRGTGKSTWLRAHHPEALWVDLLQPDVHRHYAARPPWTIKEIVGHLADDERIFAYRALAIARGDEGELPGFDEGLYVATAGFERRAFADLLAEYGSVRQASLTLFAGLPAAAWLRSGTVNGYRASVRGLAFHIAAHELHHLRVLRERYLPRLG